MATKILSGMRPTGRLHIGHLVGALDNWVQLQEKYDSYYFVADWHAITTQTDTRNIKKNTIEMVKDWLADGINPEKSILFIQSNVPEHAELHLVFSMLNTLPRLERLPTFKGQLKHLMGIIDPEIDLNEKQIENAKSRISYGFLGYPVLQAADILLYKADAIPVGEDQLSHVELTREIARKFNSLYGKIFPEPEPLLTNTPRVLGTDGRKMSKSYFNVILPTDSLETIAEGVKKMITDPGRKKKTDMGNPSICSVYDLHLAYNDQDRHIEIYKDCIGAKVGCTDCKKEIASKIFGRYEKYREERAKLDGKDDYIKDILSEGSKKARREATKTIAEVKQCLLLDY